MADKLRNTVGKKERTLAAQRGGNRAPGKKKQRELDYGPEPYEEDEQARQESTGGAPSQAGGTAPAVSTDISPEREQEPEKPKGGLGHLWDTIGLGGMNEEERNAAAARTQAAEAYQDEQNALLAASKERERQAAAGETGSTARAGDALPENRDAARQAEWSRNWNDERLAATRAAQEEAAKRGEGLTADEQRDEQKAMREAAQAAAEPEKPETAKPASGFASFMDDEDDGEDEIPSEQQALLDTVSGNGLSAEDQRDEQRAMRGAANEAQEAEQRDPEREALAQAAADAQQKADTLDAQDKTWWGPMDWDALSRAQAEAAQAQKALTDYDTEAAFVNWEGRDALISELNEIDQNSGNVTDPEQANAEAARRAEIIRELEAGDEAAGNGPQSYNDVDRARQIMSGSTGQYASGFVNAAGTALDWLGTIGAQYGNASPYAGYATDELSAAAIGTGTEEEKQAHLAEMQAVQNTAAQIEQVADSLGENAAADLASAKAGLSGLGAAGVDIATNVIQMGYDAALGKIPGGSALLSMFLRSAGGASQEARQAGASVGEQVAYGITKGGIEVATEKLFDGVAGIFGKGAADDVVEGAIRRLAETDTGRTVLRALAGAGGEGAEEAISDLLAPFAEQIYNDESLRNLWENGYDGSEILYDFLIGAAIGGLGSGGSIATGQDAVKNAEARQADAAEANVNAMMDGAMEALENPNAGQEQNTPVDPAQVLAEQATGTQPVEARQTSGEERAEGQAPAEVRQQADEVVDALLGPMADAQAKEEAAERVAEILTAPTEEAAETPQEAPEAPGDIPAPPEAAETSTGESPALNSGLRQEQSGDTMEQQNTEARADRFREMKANGNTPGEIYAETGIFEFGGKLYDGVGGPEIGAASNAGEDLQSNQGGNRENAGAEGQPAGALSEHDGRGTGNSAFDGAEQNQEAGFPGRVSERESAEGSKPTDRYHQTVDYAPEPFTGESGREYSAEEARELAELSDEGIVYAVQAIMNGEMTDEAADTLQALLDEAARREAEAAETRNALDEIRNRLMDPANRTVDDINIPSPSFTSEDVNRYFEQKAQGESAPSTPTGETAITPSESGEVQQSDEGNGNPPVPPGGGGGGLTQPGTPAQKRSKTESNTLHNVAEALGGEQEELYYIPITERQTLTEAVNRVRADMNGEMQKLMDKELWTAADIDTGLTLYGILKADAVRTGDNTAANAWARVVQSHGTRSAQALQAFSKWTRSGVGQANEAVDQLNEHWEEEDRRNPPQNEEQRQQREEQRNRTRNDILDFGQQLDEIEDGDFTSIRDLIQRQSEYRGTGTFVQRNYRRILDEIEDYDYLREYATRQLFSIAEDQTVDATLGQRLKTWQVNAQLSRLGTFFRNIGGNVMFGLQDTLTQDGLGVAIDRLVSRATGHRTVGADLSWFSREARRGSREAMLRSILEVAGDVNMGGNTNRYGTNANRTNKMNGNGFERFMSRWEQLLGYSLTTSDRASRGSIETAIRQSLRNTDLTEEQIQAIAEQTADYRLFQNHGQAYRLSKGLHDLFNVIGIGGENNGNARSGGFGLGDLVNPYPGVPANLAVKALEYSPANIIKGSVELHRVITEARHGNYDAAAQNRAVMDVARGLAGAPIIYLLTAMFKSGLAKNADDEDDLDVAAQNKAEGKTGVQINLDAWDRANKGESTEWKDGDDLLSIGWLEPMNAFMAIASMAAEEDDASLGTMAGHYLNGALQSVLDMPVMGNISNLVDNFKYSTAENIGGKAADAAIGFLGDAASGMIPAPISQAARTRDQYYRDVTGDSKTEQVINSLFNSIPGLRETLPIKTDNFGNSKEYSGDAVQRFLNNFVLPGSINEINQTETSAAVEDLYARTGDADVYPDRNAPTSFKAGDTKYRMTSDERRAYHQTYGDFCDENIGRLLTSGEYDDMSDADKVAMIGEIKKYAGYFAKRDVLAARGETYSSQGMDKTAAIVDSGIDLLSYLTGRTTADKNGNGYYTQEELYNWLIHSDYSDAQRAMIWDSNTTGNKTWAAYSTKK